MIFNDIKLIDDKGINLVEIASQVQKIVGPFRLLNHYRHLKILQEVMKIFEVYGYIDNNLHIKYTWNDWLEDQYTSKSTYYDIQGPSHLGIKKSSKGKFSSYGKHGRNFGSSPSIYEIYD